jgi:hypothetical protein
MPTLKQLKQLCKKYNLIVSGTKKQLGKRLYNLRSDIMSKKDLKIIKDFLKVKTHKRNLKRTRKKRSKKAGMGFNDLVTYFTRVPPESVMGSPLGNQQDVTDEIVEKMRQQRELVKRQSRYPDLATIEAYPMNTPGVPDVPDVPGVPGVPDVPDVKSIRPHWDVVKSVEILIPRIDEALGNFGLKDDDYDYERKLHVIIGSKYDSDDYLPYLTMNKKDSGNLDHHKLNELFRRRGKFIHKDQVAIGHSNFESNKEHELFPESSFSKEMKQEFKDLYDWERRFPSGDAVDRLSVFRKRARYQPKYPNEEGIHFQYYDVFDKDFVTP